jgi:hypothetical protein
VYDKSTSKARAQAGGLAGRQALPDVPHQARHAPAGRRLQLYQRCGNDESGAWIAERVPVMIEVSRP